MTIKKNNFKSPLFREQEENRSVKLALDLLNKIRKQPVFLFAIFALILVAMPMLAEYKIISSADVTSVGTVIIFCIIALGFCLLLGYSALASLGTAGFIGIGAYAAYYGIVEWGLGIGVAFIIAIVAALVIGVLVGYISLRIEGIYLAIVTLGVAQIIKEVLSAVCDTIQIKGKDLIVMGERLKTNHVFYILVAVLFLLMWITSNLMNSPTGRAMLAMKNSTSAAQAFGISLLKYRLLAFMISIVFASVAGFLYMLYVRYVSNSSSTLFSLSTSLNILGAVIIGGTKSIWGTIGGVFIIYGIDKLFLQDIEFFRKNPTFITLFCGILVVVVVMFYPGGLAQLMIELKLKATKLIRRLKEGRYGKDLG